MAVQTASLLNRLEKALPEGLVVDAAWLEKHGVASNLRAYYVKAGWLEQPVRSVYRRPRGTLSWQQVVISLQSLLLQTPVIVGGRTALELQGFAHYLSFETKTVHLYGPDRPPAWLQKLNLPQRFVYHNSATLFRNDLNTQGLGSLAWNIADGSPRDLSRFQGGSLTSLPWGQWDWPLTLSQPERAYGESGDDRSTADRPEHAFRAAGRLLQQPHDIGTKDRADAPYSQFHANAAGAADFQRDTKGRIAE